MKKRTIGGKKTVMYINIKKCLCSEKFLHQYVISISANLGTKMYF